MDEQPTPIHSKKSGTRLASERLFATPDGGRDRLFVASARRHFIGLAPSSVVALVECEGGQGSGGGHYCSNILS